jgi:hypothetical protein
MYRSSIRVESLESRRLMAVHAPGIITGEVFNDINGSGAINSGENGIGGVRVFVDLKKTGVYASGDPFVTTASNGKYSFSLFPDTYNINVQPPSGYQHTFPFGGKDAVITATDSVTTSGHNFGLTQSVHVGGIVQVNTNGHITPLGGVKITVKQTTGSKTFTTTTNSAGGYGIGGLPRNFAYKVTMTLPSGYLASGSLTQTTPVLGSGKSDDAVNFLIKPIVALNTSKRFVEASWEIGGPPMTKTQTASGNSAFNGNASGSETFPLFLGDLIDVISVAGSATQNSTVSMTEFTDSGKTMAREQDDGSSDGASAKGESFFSETFTLNASVHYSLTASFSANATGGAATLSFKGPGGASVFSTQTGSHGHPINTSKSGTLAAGTYTITFDVTASDSNTNVPTSTYALDLKL